MLFPVRNEDEAALKPASPKVVYHKTRDLGMAKVIVNEG
jgi:hypothetical protein